MSHVDTSIGFSLRSEPPRIAIKLSGASIDLDAYSSYWLKEKLEGILSFMLILAIAHPIFDPFFKGWPGWQRFAQDLLSAPIIAVAGWGVFYLFFRLRQDRRVRKMRELGFDSPVVHLAAEGQWITFRFASGREFVDRWDRLLRFKAGDEFTEFEFPANPPLIIPSSSIPEETRTAISEFCAVEKIPSETKR